MIELIIVITLVSVLSAVAIGRWRNFTVRQRAEAAAQRIVRDFAYVQSVARSWGSAQTLTLNQAAGSYALTGATALDRSTGGYSVNLAAEPYNARISALDVDAAKPFLFNGYGLPDHGGKIDITVGDVVKTILIDADSGKAVIQ